MSHPLKLVIVGDSAFAEIACEYFTHDSEYEVVGFSVEQDYMCRDTLLGRPVVPFESLQQDFAPESHSFFVAVTYAQQNRLRRRLMLEAEAKGYRAAGYVSSQAFVWRNVAMGRHCFIFENNVVQPFVRLGDNVVLWSGNHIGHHSVIGDDCFISSHVVVSGFVEIGKACFLGVNSTFANNLTVGDRVLVGAGATVLGDVPDDQTVVGLWKRPKPSHGADL